MREANSGPDRAKVVRGVMGRAGVKAGVVALAVVAALAVLLAHRPGTAPAAAGSTATSASTGAATSTVRQPWPSGSGVWGAAYYGMDGRLHLAAPDGTSDVAGPRVPAPAGYAHAADVSPDGRYLAYIEDVTPPGQSAIAVVDLRATTAERAALTTIPLAATHLYWSPDGAHLAVDTGMKGIHTLYVVDVHSGGSALIPRTDNNPDGAGSAALPAFVGLLGWLDTRHVVAVEMPPAGPKAMAAPGAALAARAPRSGDGGGVAVSLDIATGAARPLVSNPTVYLTLLSADGSMGWAYGSSTGQPVRVVRLPSGEVRALPNSTAVGGSGWDVAALAPSGDTLAVPVAGGPGTPTTVALIAAATDTATVLPFQGVPLAWSSDGRTLLLLDSMPGWKQPNQPYTLSAVSPVSPDGRQVTLSARVRALFGFVRP